MATGAQIATDVFLIGAGRVGALFRVGRQLFGTAMSRVPERGGATAAAVVTMQDGASPELSIVRRLAGRIHGSEPAAPASQLVRFGYPGFKTGGQGRLRFLEVVGDLLFPPVACRVRASAVASGAGGCRNASVRPDCSKTFQGELDEKDLLLQEAADRPDLDHQLTKAGGTKPTGVSHVRDLEGPDQSPGIEEGIQPEPRFPSPAGYHI